MTHRITTRCGCVLVACTLALAGCGGYPRAPAYAPSDDPDAGFEQVDVELPGMPGDAPAPFTLQPGDTIAVQVVSTETLAVDGVMLDGTGSVHLPLVGDVVLAGNSLTDAERTITRGMQQFDRLAQVRVALTGRGGQRATVLGAVQQQGPVELHPAARITDVVAAAGGPITTFTGPTPVPVADIAGAVMMRNGEKLPINMDLALRGDPKHNVYVQPGDHIYMPPSTGRHVTVLGQTGNPQLFAHRAGLRLTEALALAGGINVGGDKDDIRVIRGSLLQPKVYRASLADIVSGSSHDVVLQPGDIIFVTDHWIEDFSEVMGVIAPVLSLGLSSVALAIALDR